MTKVLRRCSYWWLWLLFIWVTFVMLCDTLTQERVRDLFLYDPESGLLTNRASRGRARGGDEAGGLSQKGYRHVSIDGVTYRGHRVIWLWVYGSWPTQAIDHINGVKDDNRIVNLRDATLTENQRNRRTPDNNTSGVQGVSWKKKARKWQASIKLGGKVRHLGYFDDLSDAREARKLAEYRHNFHANHGG